MSNVNAKNVLQEYCAKNKMPLPTYVTENIEECKSTLPVWVSTVTLVHNDSTNTSDSVTGVAQSTKVKAEISAAEMMLKIIVHTDNKPVSVQHSSLLPLLPLSVDGSSSGIYLIDLENVQLVSKQSPLANQLWIGFISQTHGTLDKYDHWYQSNKPLYDYVLHSQSKGGNISTVHDNKQGNCYLYVLDNQGRKDMMDHYITAFTLPIANYMLQNKISDNIYIVSKDLAAWCSKACLEMWLTDFGLNNTVTVLSKM
jgi:hypothetical protein